MDTSNSAACTSTRGSEGLAVKHVAGLSFVYRASSVDEVVLDSSYQELRFPVGLAMAEAPVIIDVGAHIGAFAVQAARSLPTATVYALEPSRSSFSLLKTNIERNGLTNALPLRLALGGADGDVLLYHAEENWGHSLFKAVVRPDASSETVPCLTLGSFLAAYSLDRVDLVKMNAEGVEYSILLGTPDATLQRISRLEVEVHPVPGYQGLDLVARLRACGHDVEVDWSPHELGKGWIHAALPGLPEFPTRSPLGESDEPTVPPKSRTPCPAWRKAQGQPGTAAASLQRPADAAGRPTGGIPG
jgi:FkbM family methyltransferase